MSQGGAGRPQALPLHRLFLVASIQNMLCDLGSHPLLWRRMRLFLSEVLLSVIGPEQTPKQQLAVTF